MKSQWNLVILHQSDEPQLRHAEEAEEHHAEEVAERHAAETAEHSRPAQHPSQPSAAGGGTLWPIGDT